MQDDVPFDSKSKRKRDMIALQKIGETLVELPAAQLSQVPLDSVLREAIIAARTLPSHGAKRRQLQYIGRLMREVEDVAPIQEAINKFALKSQQGKAKFHQIERWRDKLASGEDDVMQEFLVQFPDADRQQLRQLVRNAKKKGSPDRVLFQFLKNIIDG